MQGITLIFFPSGVLVCGVCLCSATATRVQVCRSTQRECVCVCASLGLLLYRSLSLSPPARYSGTQLPDCASQSSLQTDGEGRRKGNKSEEEQRRGRDDRQQGLCQKGESRVQKIENQEKRTLKGAERSGVWRRGDKGRGLIRKRDKYGAMHHSGNTGRTKTLSHETGKTLRYFQSDGIVLYSLQRTV